MIKGITEKDVLSVYERLKDKYDLELTTSFELDEGYTANTIVIVGKAHEQIIELYVSDEMFVMDVMDEEQTCGTHWHPYNVDIAVNDIVEFMEGKTDYKMYPFGQV